MIIIIIIVRENNTLHHKVQNVDDLNGDLSSCVIHCNRHLLTCVFVRAAYDYMYENMPMHTNIKNLGFLSHFSVSV